MNEHATESTREPDLNTLNTAWPCNMSKLTVNMWHDI